MSSDNSSTTTAILEQHLTSLQGKLSQSVQACLEKDSRIVQIEEQFKLMQKSQANLDEKFREAREGEARARAETAKTAAELQLMQGVNKLNKSMLDMKKKELEQSQEVIKQLKGQLDEKPKVNQDSSLEQLRAQVHSLAYLNQQL